MRDSQIPHNDLPLLPPDLELETSQVLRKAIAANRELAELKGVGPPIPNQALLVQMLGFQEAKLSCEIENIVTTNDELYKAVADRGELDSSYETKEVIRYSDALWLGYHHIKEKKRPITTRLLVDMAATVTGQKPGVRQLPGTHLRGRGGRVIYTPPEGEERILKLLENLGRYIYEPSTVDPLVAMAVLHYQFEAIHPFYDGNGRVGRVLNLLYLVEKGLLHFPILYLSRYVMQNRQGYYEGLNGVTTKGNWENWILYILDGVETMARDTRHKILEITQLMDRVKEKIRQELPKIYSKDLLEVLFSQPYTKISFLEAAGIARRQTASRYLKALAEAGILEVKKVGREFYYLNRPFFDLLVRP